MGQQRLNENGATSNGAKQMHDLMPGVDMDTDIVF